MDRQKPGVVRDAIIAALREADHDGLPVQEVEARVNQLLGVNVSSSSVRSYLNLNTPDIFDRVSRGRYRMRS